MENTLKTNGLKVKSWGDVAAIVAIMTPTLAMLLATVMWGLKLEAELNIIREHSIQQERRLANIESEIREGILRVAKERVDANERRIDRLERRHLNGN